MYKPIREILGRPRKTSVGLKFVDRKGCAPAYTELLKNEAASDLTATGPFVDTRPWDVFCYFVGPYWEIKNTPIVIIPSDKLVTKKTRTATN